MTHLLCSDMLLDGSLCSPLGSGNSSRKLSGRGTAALAGSASTSHGARGGQGGRRSSSGAALGKSSTGVIKDTTRRKVAEIARLEEQLRDKLNLASGLERQNDELQRKERLLKLQVKRRMRV